MALKNEKAVVVIEEFGLWDRGGKDGSSHLKRRCNNAATLADQ